MCSVCVANQIQKVAAVECLTCTNSVSFSLLSLNEKAQGLSLEANVSSTVIALCML